MGATCRVRVEYNSSASSHLLPNRRNIYYLLIKSRSDTLFLHWNDGSTTATTWHAWWHQQIGSVSNQEMRWPSLSLSLLLHYEAVSRVTTRGILPRPVAWPRKPLCSHGPKFCLVASLGNSFLLSLGIPAGTSRRASNIQQTKQIKKHSKLLSEPRTVTVDQNCVSNLSNDWLLKEKSKTRTPNRQNVQCMVGITDPNKHLKNHWGKVINWVQHQEHQMSESSIKHLTIAIINVLLIHLNKQKNRVSQ